MGELKIDDCRRLSRHATAHRPAGEKRSRSNRTMEEWGPDGRLAPGAPVHSPYIRRRQQLELE